MGEVTINQIVAVIGILTAIIGFITLIYKWYKSNFIDKFSIIEKRIEGIEKKAEIQDEDIQDSKEERKVLLRGVLACLKGMKEDLNCNGPVTQGINDIETYLETKSHK